MNVPASNFSNKRNHDITFEFGLHLEQQQQQSGTHFDF